MQVPASFIAFSISSHIKGASSCQLILDTDSAFEYKLQHLALLINQDGSP